MKFPLLAALLAALIVSTSPAADLDSIKTADELWTHLLAINGEQMQPNLSREETIEALRSWLTRQAAAAEAFLKRFPTDARRWDVKMIAASAAKQMVDFGGPPLNGPLLQKDIDDLLAAPDASPGARSEAAFFRVTLLADKAELNKPESIAELQAALSAFLETYPLSKRAEEAVGIQMQLIAQLDPPNADELLRKLSGLPNPQVAGRAKMELHKREIIAELRKRPLSLRFFATNGKQVDFAKLRGRVVMIDFWASWCPPCMEEAPNITKTYQQFHDKGFEIVGACLDQEQEKMLAAIKQHGMTWPQYFDGKGYDTEMSRAFGVYSLPSSFLLDKKGLLRAVSPRGAQLPMQVSKLLAE